MPASQTVSLVDSLRQLTNAFADPDIQTYIGKYVAGFVALILTSAVIYKAANDQDAMNDKFFTYMLFAVIPACFGLALVLRASNSKLTPSNGIFYTIVFLLFLWGVTSVYKMRNPSSVKTLSALLSVVGVLAIVVGLAIGYRLIHRIVVNMRGWTGLFFKILFIIPCFVIEFLESLSADLKSTPKMVLVLLALEALLLVVYYRLPQWVGKHVMGVSPDEEVVLPNPMFLSTKVVVAPTLPPSPSPLDPESEVAKANFAVSFWAYVNDQPQTQAAAYARESNIFRYGHPIAVQSSHPRLTYNSKAFGKTPWAVYLSDTDTPHATLNLPNQAWNHFVFNYQGNQVDLFVNGNLVKSVQLSDPPRIDKTDVFVLGDGDNSVWGGGLHGAISNVVYHFNALTQNAIAAAYNWKKHSNPPTSGIT